MGMWIAICLEFFFFTQDSIYAAEPFADIMLDEGNEFVKLSDFEDSNYADLYEALKLNPDYRSFVIEITKADTQEEIQKQIDSLEYYLCRDEKSYKRGTSKYDADYFFAGVLNLLRAYIKHGVDNDLRVEKQIQLLGRLVLLFPERLTPEILEQNNKFLAEMISSLSSPDPDAPNKGRSLALMRRCLEAYGEHFVALQLLPQKWSTEQREIQRLSMFKAIHALYKQLTPGELHHNELYLGPGELKLKQTFLAMLLVGSRLDFIEEIGVKLFDSFLDTQSVAAESGASEAKTSARQNNFLNLSGVQMAVAWLAKIGVTSEGPRVDRIKGKIRGLHLMRLIFAIKGTLGTNPFRYFKEDTKLVLEEVQRRLEPSADIVDYVRENRAERGGDLSGRPYSLASPQDEDKELLSNFDQLEMDLSLRAETPELLAQLRDLRDIGAKLSPTLQPVAVQDLRASLPRKAWWRRALEAIGLRW